MPHTAPTTRRAALVVLAILMAVLARPVLAAAQDATPSSPTPTVEVDADSPVGQIIPKPNSGAAPEEPGDRGGYLQVGLLYLMLAVIALGALHLWRQSKKLRATRAE